MTDFHRLPFTATTMCRSWKHPSPLFTSGWSHPVTVVADLGFVCSWLVVLVVLWGHLQDAGKQGHFQIILCCNDYNRKNYSNQNMTAALLYYLDSTMCCTVQILLCYDSETIFNNLQYTQTNKQSDSNCYFNLLDIGICPDITQDEIAETSVLWSHPSFHMQTSKTNSGTSKF